MNKKQKNLAIILVAILAVALAIYYYQTAVMQTTKAGTIITVNYEDGTSEKWDSNKQAYGLALLSVGKTVSSVKVEVYITPTFEGSVASYAVSGTFSMQLRCVQTSSILYSSGTVALQPLSPLPTLVSGQAKVITSSTLSASQIEALYTGIWVNGYGYQLIWTAPSPLSMTITFADGTVQTKTADIPTSSILLEYKSASQFTALSATFYATAY